MRLEEITIDESVKLLEQIETEGEFLKEKSDANRTILQIVSKFKNKSKFAIYNFLKGRKRIGLITSFPNEINDTVSLGVTYLKPKYRGKGFGKIMIGKYINKARELGYKRIATQTWSSNEKAQKLLEGLGFKKRQTVLASRSNGDSTITYELKL